LGLIKGDVLRFHSYTTSIPTEHVETSISHFSVDFPEKSNTVALFIWAFWPAQHGNIYLTSHANLFVQPMVLYLQFCLVMLEIKLQL